VYAFRHIQQFPLLSLHTVPLVVHLKNLKCGPYGRHISPQTWAVVAHACCTFEIDGAGPGYVGNSYELTMGNNRFIIILLSMLLNYRVLSQSEI
jgi:hypothetical protein